MLVLSTVLPGAAAAQLFGDSAASVERFGPDCAELKDHMWEVHSNAAVNILTFNGSTYFDDEPVILANQTNGAWAPRPWEKDDRKMQYMFKYPFDQLTDFHCTAIYDTKEGKGTSSTMIECSSPFAPPTFMAELTACLTADGYEASGGDRWSHFRKEDLDEDYMSERTFEIRARIERNAFKLTYEYDFWSAY